MGSMRDLSLKSITIEQEEPRPTWLSHPFEIQHWWDAVPGL